MFSRMIIICEILKMYSKIEIVSRKNFSDLGEYQISLNFKIVFSKNIESVKLKQITALEVLIHLLTPESLSHKIKDL